MIKTNLTNILNLIKLSDLISKNTGTMYIKTLMVVPQRAKLKGIEWEEWPEMAHWAAFMDPTFRSGSIWALLLSCSPHYLAKPTT